MVLSAPNTKKKKFHAVSVYKEALANFSDSLSSANDTSVLASNELVDEFFEYVACTGRPSLPWSDIRAPLVWMLERKINDMHNEEIDEELNSAVKEELKNSEYIRSSKQFILEKANSFDGTPFTIQRLCELITTPTRHYHVTEKYLRALEKNVNVVTTVTEKGDRITGSDIFNNGGDLSPPVPMERNFIVSVDELDDPLPITVQRNGIASSGDEKQDSRSGNKGDSESPISSDESSVSDKETNSGSDADTSALSSSGQDDETASEPHSSSEEEPKVVAAEVLSDAAMDLD